MSSHLALGVSEAVVDELVSVVHARGLRLGPRRAGRRAPAISIAGGCCRVAVVPRGATVVVAVENPIGRRYRVH